MEFDGGKKEPSYNSNMGEQAKTSALKQLAITTQKELRNSHEFEWFRVVGGDVSPPRL